MEKWIEIIIAMKQIYLINTRNRAASYGIGTYINQLITCLYQTASLYLTVVELDSDEKEVTLVKQDNIRYLKFPQISSFLYNTYTDRYNRNVAYLFSLFAASFSAVDGDPPDGVAQEPHLHQPGSPPLKRRPCCFLLNSALSS